MRQLQDSQSQGKGANSHDLCACLTNKCDETKPRCLRCDSTGLGCSYEAGIDDMQLSVPGTFKIDLGPISAAPAFPLFLPLAGEGGDERYQMSWSDRAALDKFRSTHVLTVGPTEYSQQFQSTAVELSREVSCPIGGTNVAADDKRGRTRSLPTSS